jgi:hypothetical protein
VVLFLTGNSNHIRIAVTDIKIRPAFKNSYRFFINRRIKPDNVIVRGIGADIEEGVIPIALPELVGIVAESAGESVITRSAKKNIIAPVA